MVWESKIKMIEFVHTFPKRSFYWYIFKHMIKMIVTKLHILYGLYREKTISGLETKQNKRIVKNLRKRQLSDNALGISKENIGSPYVFPG